jgi:bifunctional non-homologous end joining protein LigD
MKAKRARRLHGGEPGPRVRRVATPPEGRPFEDEIAPIPFRVGPMLATLVAGAFHRPGWIYEEKYDGIRLIAYKEGARVSLMTRNMIDRTERFPRIAEAVRTLPAPTLALDGEAVVFDAEAVSRFGLLQRGEGGEEVFVVFDCLYARGHDLRACPLVERRAALEREMREGPALKVARRLGSDGRRALAQAKRLALEGLIAKDPQSQYLAGLRSPAWKKIKLRNEEEFVVGGFTRPEGSRAHFGALLVGVYDGAELRYAGGVGTGFTAATLADLRRRFEPLIRSTSPFADLAKFPGATWLEPHLVAQVGFTEWTADRRLRHPTFLGLREDKPARDVRR